jgi:zinc D-Ala-D-Ala carboxypeptidase
MYNTIPAPKNVRHKNSRHKILLVVIALVLIIFGIIYLYLQTISNNTEENKSNFTGFDKSRYSTESADSLWVIVNKGRVLPSDYAPSDLKVPKVPLRLESTSPEMMLRAEAANALEKLIKASDNENIKLMLASGFRSYDSQKLLYSFYVNNQGKESADSSSAKAGYSEHQTGLAADIESISRQCEVETCFAKMPEGKWLKANAHKFGYIMRYQKDKVKLTGYDFEPWHFRYVGTALAKQLYSSNLTMEQFFGLYTVNEYSPNPLKLK